LSRKLFAAFLVYMKLSVKEGERYHSHVASWLDPIRALVRPVSAGLFAGVLIIRKVPTFKDRVGFRGHWN
jgi:hypothetical protein